MKLLKFASLIFGVQLLAQEIDSSSALFSLAEAERSFAKTSVAEGARLAFVNNLADNAILFRPGPVKGKPIWVARKPAPFSLKWEPEFVDIAVSADFGYSTGPSEFGGWQPNAPADQYGYGYFTSIWKKQADGAWKVALDIGIETPKTNGETQFKFLSGADKKGSQKIVAEKDATESLLKRDQEFSAAWSKNSEVSNFFATHARIHRSGKLPTTGMDGVKTALVLVSECKAELAEVASSGDMGYVYGTYRKSDQETGWYLRIWKKTEEWKIVLDLQAPNPPQKK